MNFFQQQQKLPFVQPEIEVTVTFSSPLIPLDFFITGNIIHITMEGCFSLPDQMLLNDKDTYVAGLLLPLQTEEEEPIIFYRGALQHQPATSEPGKFWFNSSSSQVVPAAIENSRVVYGRYIEDFGDFQDESEYIFRNKSEFLSHITWNTEFRSLMMPTAILKFINMIKHSPFLPVEFIRVYTGPSNGPTKGKAKEDDGPITFYAMAFVNLASLIFPGVDKVHGAYQLQPFSKAKIENKLKRTPSYLTNQEHGLLVNTLMAGELGDKYQDKPLPGFSESEKLKAKTTYLTMNIQFHHPIVPERPPEEISFRYVCTINWDANYPVF